MSIPKMNSGGIGAYNRMLQAPLYEKISDILGSAGTIFPLVDQIESDAFRPSSTVPESAPTYTEAVSAWDTPFTFNNPDCYQGIIPFLTFNGSDEYLDYADDDYFSRDDGGSGEGFSIGWWSYHTVSGAGATICKTGGDPWGIEWIAGFSSNPSNTAHLFIFDQSTGGWHGRRDTDTPNHQNNQWEFYVFTCDGSAAVTGLEGYYNGDFLTVGSFPEEQSSGSYTAMENYAGATINIGHRGVDFFPGRIAGGPLGPFYTHSVLTAAQVAHLYRLGRQALEL